MVVLDKKTKKKKRKTHKLFGISMRTKEQKRFFRYFIIIKTIVYAIIFALALYFLYKLKNIGN
ncbi:MAG: hypothetical protein N3D84_00230 [Candidatus Woesearchaeota archaeon]|nr:hypothetical protein [Candidatus Woesearchaeota archaeon]